MKRATMVMRMIAIRALVVLLTGALVISMVGCQAGDEADVTINETNSTKATTDPVATKPTATKPSATEPSTTEPSVTESPITEPFATEPSTTEPSAMEPSTTEAPATKPSVTEPTATEPPATKPSVMDPPATEPPAMKPSVTEPSATEPSDTKPSATEPSITEPSATEPPATKPSVTEPPATKPSVTEPSTTEHRHQYTVKETKPTCTTAGVLVHTCACGATVRKDGRPALGHDYRQTARENGQIQYTCTRCDNVRWETDPDCFDETLVPPEILSVFAGEYHVEINCKAEFENYSGYGYQAYLSRTSDFSDQGQETKVESGWNGQKFARLSWYYTYGSYYYKVRSYRTEGEKLIYGPWSEVGEVSCANFQTRRPGKAEYSYELYFVDELGEDIYTEDLRPVYIKTDNPNPESIKLMAGGEYILGSAHMWGDWTYFDDVEYLDITNCDAALNTVEGGYLAMLDVKTAGELKVELWEGTPDGYVVAKSFAITAWDYETARNQWIDDVIASQTTAEMNPKEKMDAIAAFLLNGQFKYLTGVNGRMVNLASQPNSPWFLTKRWDSCTSPAMLAVFAERIGGFEEIHNCYGDYVYGTSEWKEYHHQTYVIYGGEKYYYTVCPSTPSGDVGSVEMIDFSNVSKLHRIC